MLGVVAAIVRYPVKSMRGEQLPATELTASGLAFDRLYAFESEAAPPGMLRVAGRERRELLRFAARHTCQGVQVTTPAGDSFSVDDPRLIQSLPGFSPTRLTCESEPQTDCRPVSLIGLQTIRELGKELGMTLDPRRFRANFYLNLAEPFAEDQFVGHTIAIGPQVRLRILERDPRCRFITLDPETTEAHPALMKLLHARHQGRAGIYASIDITGTVAVGDPVQRL